MLALLLLHCHLSSIQLLCSSGTYYIIYQVDVPVKLLLARCAHTPHHHAIKDMIHHITMI